MDYKRAIKSNIDLELLMGNSREGYLPRQRHFIYLLLSRTMRLTDIAKIMNKHHSTVLFGIRRAKSANLLRFTKQVERYEEVLSALLTKKEDTKLSEYEIMRVCEILGEKFFLTKEAEYDGYIYSVTYKKIKTEKI